MAIFMKHAKIPGEVTAAGYEEWVELTGLGWAVSRGTAEGAGASGQREGGAATATALTCRRTTDTATPHILTQAFSGAAEPTVRIHVTVTDPRGKHIPKRELTLSRAVVTGYGVSATAGSVQPPAETFSLVFQKLDHVFHDLDRDQRSRGRMAFMHDFAEPPT